MASVFLSYAREDGACAEALTRLLEQAGHVVWWDRHIDGGSEFAAEIEAALEKCDIVLVAWSKVSVKSRWVRDEAGVGGDSGRLIPVSIDGSPPPMGFRQFQTLELAGWKGAKKDERTDQLLQAIERRLKGAPGAPIARSPQPTRRIALWKGRPIWAAAALLVLLIVAGAVLFVLNGRDRLLGPAAKPTMALLPFAAPKADAELSNVATQARESLAQAFSQSGIPVRRLDTVPLNAARDADYVISGEFGRNGEKVVATVRLDEPAHGVTVFSKRFEAGPDDIGDLPDRIGAQMAGTLAWAGPLMTLDRRHPSDPAITAELLQQSDFTTDELQAYQIAKRISAKAPNSAIAQVSLAFDTGIILEALPREERPRAVAAARRAAERALTLAPDFGDTYGSWCFLHSETRMVECEDRLRAGKRIDPDAPFLNSFHSSLARSVGRFDEAFEFARLSYAHDPFVPTKIGWMLRMLEFTGDADQARRLYQQGVRWWPEYKENFFRQRLSGILALGDFAAGRRLEQEVGSKNYPPNYVDSGALVAAVRSKSLAAAKRSCAGAEFLLIQVRCMLAFAQLDDYDSAFAIADKLYPPRIGRTAAETDHIWLDDPGGTAPLEFLTSRAAAPMRRDPRYLKLAQRVGLLNYWRSGRPPDFCRKPPEPICRQFI